MASPPTPKRATRGNRRANTCETPQPAAKVVKYGRTRSAEVCPWCGAKYERFRSSSVPSFAAASAVMIAAAQAMVAERQDYSKPARRPAILGYMHQCKLAAWRDEHLHWCAQQHEQRSGSEPPF